MNRTVTIILIVLALVLGAGAIYLGYRLTQQEPTDVSVVSATCDIAGCGWCGDSQDWNTCCNEGRNCQGEEWTIGWAACSACNVSGGDENPACTISINGQITGFTLGSACTSDVKIRRYTRSYSGTSHLFYPDCITNDSNGTGQGIEDGQAGSTYEAYSPGECVQIDADGGGVNAGVCRCVPAAARCGDGTINQTSEQCESGIACSGDHAGEVCNTSTCTCTPAVSNTCGDGEINQDTEECEVGVACTDGSTCNENTCLCTPAECGNGTLDEGEYCDPTADPTGCLTGETCNAYCQCDISVTLPSTAIIDDKTDEILYAALAVVTGLFLLKFNVKGFVIGSLSKTSNFLQKGKLAYVTAPVSEKAQTEVRQKRKNQFEERVGK